MKRKDTRSMILSLSVLTLMLLLSACSPASLPTVVAPVVTPAVNTQIPSQVPSQVPQVIETDNTVPATGQPALAMVATSRGPNLIATDPASVNLASGQLQLVEFFRFT